MSKLDLNLDVHLKYDSFPFPKKMIIPIEPGKFLLFKYKQHDYDPIAVERIELGYGGGNHITISMRGTGRIAVDNLPDIKIGGTKIEITADLKLDDTTFRLHRLKLARLALPNIAQLTDDFFKNILNKYLLSDLEKKLQFDLRDTLQSAVSEINKPVPFQINFGNETYKYDLSPGCELIKPGIDIAAEGIHLKLNVIFSPEIIFG